MILAANGLLALAENGELVAVEATPKAYHETARFQVLSGKCWNNPALAAGRVFARSTKEGVCLDLTEKSGELRLPLGLPVR